MLGTAGGPFEVWHKRGVNWIALASDCSNLFGKSREILTHVQEVEGAEK